MSVDGMKVLHDLKHLRMMLVDLGLNITKNHSWYIISSTVNVTFKFQWFAVVLCKRHAYFTHPLGASFVFILQDVTINVSSFYLLTRSDSYNSRDALFLKFILVKKSTCFRNLLAINTSFNSVYTEIGICHASYVGCSLARSLADGQHNWHDKYLLLCIQCWNSWWWTVDLSETYRIFYENKFEK